MADTSIYTAHYQFPLPSPGNTLRADVARLALFGVAVDNLFYQHAQNIEFLSQELASTDDALQQAQAANGAALNAAKQEFQQGLDQLQVSKMNGNAVIPIAQGGTGATTWANARAALGITDPTWANVQNKPNTVLGFNITDAMTIAGGRFNGSVQMPNTQAVGYAGDPGGLRLGGVSDAAAVMTFHRSSYAINFGLDTDNVIRIGGWSQGSGGYRMHLDAGGNLTATGNVTAYSDRRLKKDLQVIEGALDKVKKLTGYTYTRKDTGERHTGLIAQDVQLVLPEAVRETLGILTVSYGNMLGLMAEAIKELDAKVEKLKARAE